MIVWSLLHIRVLSLTKHITGHVEEALSHLETAIRNAEFVRINDRGNLQFIYKEGVYKFLVIIASEYHKRNLTYVVTTFKRSHKKISTEFSVLISLWVDAIPTIFTQLRRLSAVKDLLCFYYTPVRLKCQHIFTFCKFCRSKPEWIENQTPYKMFS